MCIGLCSQAQGCDILRLSVMGGLQEGMESACAEAEFSSGVAQPAPQPGALFRSAPLCSARYSAGWWKENWKAQRLLRTALGEVADRFGDFVQGACVASLSHRHDVRAGIAAGALLRERIASTTLRLEILCVVRLCYYWKWQAAGFLRSLLRRAGKLQGADARGRASLYERAWAEAAAALPAADFFVVCHRGGRTAELWPHAQVRALGRRPAEDQFVYRLEEPPSRCRAGSVELAALMEDMQSGRLEGALFKLAQRSSKAPPTADAHRKLSTSRQGQRTPARLRPSIPPNGQIACPPSVPRAHPTPLCI